MAALGFWEAFNQGLETGNKLHAASAKRNMDAELAGVDQGLSPAEVAKAQGAIYTKYGNADKANDLQLRAGQLEGLQMQNEKTHSDLDAASAFKADQDHLFEVTQQARAADARARALLESGDKLGAARVIADFRSNVLQDPRTIDVADDGSVVGYENGKPVGVRSINDPAVLNSLISGIKGSVDDYSTSILQKHLRTPAEVAQFNQQLWQRGMEQDRLGLAKRGVDLQEHTQNWNEGRDERDFKYRGQRDVVEDGFKTAQLNESTRHNKASEGLMARGQNMQQSQFNDKMSFARHQDFFPDVGKPNPSAAGVTAPQKVGDYVIRSNRGVSEMYNPETNEYTPMGVGRAPPVTDTALAYGVRHAYDPKAGWAYVTQDGRAFSSEEEALAAARPKTGSIDWRNPESWGAAAYGLTKSVPVVGPQFGAAGLMLDRNNQ